MNTIVTHTNPDQDAIVSVWLIKRFFPGWADAAVQFVPSGKTLNNQSPDSDSSIIHVDTGLGKFDHHTTGDRALCAATLVLSEIKARRYASDSSTLEALERMVGVVLEVDHALERTWPDPMNDRYDFFPEAIFYGMKSMDPPYKSDSLVRFGMELLDGLFSRMQTKVSALEAIKTGIEFESPWGKGIGVETMNDRVPEFAGRMGYQTAVWKDPKKGNVRIYIHPEAQRADLTPVFEEIRRRDPRSDWFLHASKRLLLNGSRTNPVARPTTLTLAEIIDIIQCVRTS